MVLAFILQLDLISIVLLKIENVLYYSKLGRKYCLAIQKVNLIDIQTRGCR